MWPVQGNSRAIARLPNTQPKSGKSSRVRFREDLQTSQRDPKQFSRVNKEQHNAIKLSPLAGKPAPREMLVDLARLEREYYERQPDLADRNQWVAFGTSGHRGSSLR